MSRYDFWKPLVVAVVLLVALVAIASAKDNPDGPVGAVMLEPSLVLFGQSDYEGAFFKNSEYDDDNRMFLRPTNEIISQDFDAQRYGLRVLVPIRQSITLGAHYALTRTDRATRFDDQKTTEEASTWQVGFRVRYWWNLPE
jgi:hypothetical protein